LSATSPQTRSEVLHHHRLDPLLRKDTSLGFIINYQEFVRVANLAIQELRNPIQMYLLVAVIFVVINYSLGKLAEYVERRLSQARRTAAAPATSAVMDPGAGGG
jgi:glutamate transport system permease protein